MPLTDFRRCGYIKEDMYHVWSKDFETDNFKINEIVEKVNCILEQKSYHTIEKVKVEYKINSSNVGVTKAICDLIWEKNGIRLDDVISKRQLGEILIQPRIAEIEREGWKPLLSIEKILNKIFYMVPRVIG